MRQQIGYFSAYGAFWKYYADFGSRTSREAFWKGFFIHSLVILAMMAPTYNVYVSIIERNDITAGFWLMPLAAYSVATIVPSIAFIVRRLHDIDRYWCWIFLYFIPFAGTVIFFIMLSKPSAAFDVYPGRSGSGPYIQPQNPYVPPQPNPYVPPPQNTYAPSPQNSYAPQQPPPPNPYVQQPSPQNPYVPPQQNPYAQQPQPNPYAQQPPPNPYVQQPSPQSSYAPPPQNTYAQPPQSPYTQSPQQNPYAPQQPSPQSPYAPPQSPYTQSPQQNPYAPPQPPPQSPYAQPPPQSPYSPQYNYNNEQPQYTYGAPQYPYAPPPGYRPPPLPPPRKFAPPAGGNKAFVAIVLSIVVAVCSNVYSFVSSDYLQNNLDRYVNTLIGNTFGNYFGDPYVDPFDPDGGLWGEADPWGGSIPWNEDFWGSLPGFGESDDSKLTESELAAIDHVRESALAGFPDFTIEEVLLSKVEEDSLEWDCISDKDGGPPAYYVYASGRAIGDFVYIYAGFDVADDGTIELYNLDDGERDKYDGDAITLFREWYDAMVSSIDASTV